MKTAVSSDLVEFLDGLITAGRGGSYIVADLYTFTLRDSDSTVLRWTGWGRPLTVGGNEFASGGPLFERSQIRQTVGLEADELELNIHAGPEVQVLSVPFMWAVRRGDFDGAEVLVERVFMQSPTDVSRGTVIAFKGSVATVEATGRASCRMMVESRLALLNEQMPRNLIQPACRHMLFDAGCGLSRSAHATTAAVSSPSNPVTFATTLTQPGSIEPPAAAPGLSSEAQDGTNLQAATYWVSVTYVTALGETTASPEAYLAVDANKVLKVASPPSAANVTGWNVYVGKAPGSGQRQNADVIDLSAGWTMPATGLVIGTPAPEIATDGYFAQGVIEFTSGTLAGISRGITVYRAGMVTVVQPLPSAPAAGSTFRIFPGCDKAWSTCGLKFDNTARFGGFPFCPVPEQGL